MKLIDKDLLREFNEKTICEWCRRSFPGGLDAAHIFSRGAGRVDIRGNLVSLCRECHTRSHTSGVPSLWQLLEMAAKREGCSVDDIEAKIYAIRRDQTQKVKVIS